MPASPAGRRSSRTPPPARGPGPAAVGRPGRRAALSLVFTRLSQVSSLRPSDGSVLWEADLSGGEQSFLGVSQRCPKSTYTPPLPPPPPPAANHARTTQSAKSPTSAKRTRPRGSSPHAKRPGPITRKRTWKLPARAPSRRFTRAHAGRPFRPLLVLVMQHAPRHPGERESWSPHRVVGQRCVDVE